MQPAGELDQRVTIQSKVVARDSHGGEVITWSDVATVWMQVQPITGRDSIALRQAQADVSTRFRMRYRAGIDSTMRFVWRGQIFDIEPVPAHPRAPFVEVLGRAAETST